MCPNRVGPDGWHLVFVPISNRFQTNRATTYLELLTRQLAQIARQHVIPPLLEPEQFYRNVANRLMTGLAAAGTRVLLVIDGLDEALGEERLVNLLPAKLPPTFRVLASARWIAEDREGSGWLTRLGWASPSRPADHDLVVEKLNVDSVADVLTEMGTPIDVVGRDRPLVTRLTELTEGEPLLLRFYAEDLWLKTSVMSPITLDVLNSMQPGFGPYFKAWLQDQGGVAADVGAKTDPRTTDATLAILGFAKGALTSKDLLGIAAAGFPTLPWRLIAKPHVAPFRRFVIGDGSDDFPYVFSHPKVSEYVRSDECRDMADQTSVAFFIWGRAHIAALNSGELRPERASRYALDHYLDHLAIVGDTASAEDYMAMVEDGWRRAKERHNGGPARFADDVWAARNACRRDGQTAHLGAQWRCALVLSSIKSLGINIPGPLLVELVKDAILSPQQAQHYIGLKGAAAEAVLALGDISGIDSIGELARRQFAEAAIATAISASEVRQRARLLPLAFQSFDVDRQLENTDYFSREHIGIDGAALRSMVSQVLHDLEKLHDGWELSDAVCDLAPCLDANQSEVALSIAMSIGEPYQRTRAIAALAVHCATDGREALFNLALSEIPKIHRPDSRAELLGLVAAHLPPTQRTTVKGAQLNAVLVSIEDHQASLLTELAESLDANQLQQALDAIAAKEADPAWRYDLNWPRAHIYTKLAETSNENTQLYLIQAFEAAMKIPGDEQRSETLRVLAPRFAASEQSVVLDKALAAANSISWEDVRATELGLLSSIMTERTAKRETLDEAFRSLSSVDDEGRRARAIVRLYPHAEASHRLELIEQAQRLTPKTLGEVAHVIDSEQKERAFRLATEIGDWDERAELLMLSTRILEGELRNTALKEAFDTARGIPSSENRFRTLYRLSSYLNEADRQKAISEAFNAAALISNAGRRDEALAELAGSLEEPHRERALEFSFDIGDGYPHWRTLIRLLPFLTPDDQRTLISRALAISVGIDYELRKCSALIALAPHLDREQRMQLADVAAQFQVPSCRSELYSELARHCEGNERTKFVEGAVAAALSIDDAWMRTKQLRELIQEAGEALSYKVVMTALSSAMDSQRWQVEELLALEPYLKDEQRFYALQRANDAALKRLAEDGSVDALSEVVPRLPPRLIVRLNAIANGITPGWSRARVFLEIMPYLEASDKMGAVLQAMDDINVIREPERRFSVAVQLISKLPGLQLDPLFDLALSAAAEIDQDSGRSDAFIELLAFGTSDPRIVEMAMKSTFAISKPSERVERLLKLVPSLSEEHKRMAIAKLISAVRECYRADQFVPEVSAAAPYMTKHDAERLIVLGIDGACYQVRKDVLSFTSYREALSLSVAHGGETVAQEVVRALVDVGRWYP